MQIHAHIACVCWTCSMRTGWWKCSTAETNCLLQQLGGVWWIGKRIGGGKGGFPAYHCAVPNWRTGYHPSTWSRVLKRCSARDSEPAELPWGGNWVRYHNTSEKCPLSVPAGCRQIQVGYEEATIFVPKKVWSRKRQNLRRGEKIIYGFIWVDLWVFS